MWVRVPPGAQINKYFFIYIFMKFIKTFEDSFRDEYPGMFAPEKEEDKPQLVPGFESGTINPEDTKPWEFNGVVYEPESYKYKEFLKIVKERNFQDTKDEIIIDLKRLSQDYCMSIYNWTKHIREFLKDELVGKYISKGFKNILTDENIEGIVDDVIFFYVSSHDCMAFFNLKIKNRKLDDNESCDNLIVIDKIKSLTNKYNL